MSEPIDVETKYLHSEPTPLQKAVEPCPFCGSTELTDMSRVPGCGVSCTTSGCAAEMANIPKHKWNTRSAAKQLEALQKEKEELKKLFFKEHLHTCLEHTDIERSEAHCPVCACLQLGTLKLALKKCAGALKEAGATIATAAKEQVKYPDHKRILFNGTDVTFKEMCDLTCDIANKALSDPLVKKVLEEQKK